MYDQSCTQPIEKSRHTIALMSQLEASSWASTRSRPVGLEPFTNVGLCTERLAEQRNLHSFDATGDRTADFSHARTPNHHTTQPL